MNNIKDQLGLTQEAKDQFQQYIEDNPHLFPDTPVDYTEAVSREKKRQRSDIELLSTKTDPMPYARKKITPVTPEQRQKEISYWSKVANPEQSKKPLTYEGARDTLAYFIRNYCENKGIEKFKYDKMNICAIQNIMKYFLHDVNGKYSSRKGLWIYGNMGTGKTFIGDLFSKFSRHFNLPKKYHVVSAEAVADKVRIDKKLDSISSYFGSTNYCFDDVGQERPVKIYGEQEDIMQRIIVRAYREDRKLIVTSNLAPQEVAKALSSAGIYAIEDRYKDERTVSRIYEMFNFVPLIGSNKRKL